MTHPVPANCPSCGSDTHCYRRVGRDEQMWVVICDCCGHRGMWSELSADDAIRKWNRANNLLPCPFCGTYPVLDENPINGAFRIRCPNCMSAGPESTLEVVASVWNEREVIE